MAKGCASTDWAVWVGAIKPSNRLLSKLGPRHVLVLKSAWQTCWKHGTAVLYTRKNPHTETLLNGDFPQASCHASPAPHFKRWRWRQACTSTVGATPAPTHRTVGPSHMPKKHTQHPASEVVRALACFAQKSVVVVLPPAPALCIGVAEGEAADLIAHVDRAGYTLPLRLPLLLLDERPKYLQ